MSRTIGVSLFALLIASSAQAQQIGDVFYIALENHNFTQPSTVPAGTPQQLFGNSAAPYLNSLVTPGNPNAARRFLRQQLSERFARPSPLRTQLRVPGSPGSPGRSTTTIPIQTTSSTRPNLKQPSRGPNTGHGWRSYQEDIDLPQQRAGKLNPAGDTLTNTWRRKANGAPPTSSFSGTSPSYTNPYNGAHQYNLCRQA